MPDHDLRRRRRLRPNTFEIIFEPVIKDKIDQDTKEQILHCLATIAHIQGGIKQPPRPLPLLLLRAEVVRRLLPD